MQKQAFTQIWWKVDVCLYLIQWLTARVQYAYCILSWCPCNTFLFHRFYQATRKKTTRRVLFWNMNGNKKERYIYVCVLIPEKEFWIWLADYLHFPVLEMLPHLAFCCSNVLLMPGIMKNLPDFPRYSFRLSFLWFNSEKRDTCSYSEIWIGLLRRSSHHYES